MSQPFTIRPRDTWIDHTSVVNADLDTVYSLLSDIAGWPSWTPGLLAIRQMRQGFAGSGSFFLMTLEAPKIGRLYLPNIVYQNSPEKIEWGGGALGSVIRHSFELTVIDDHTTSIRHLEYATGLLSLLAKPAAQFAYNHDMRWSRKIEEIFGG